MSKSLKDQLDNMALSAAEKIVDAHRKPLLTTQTGDAKVLLWDIETTDLHADFGTLLCVGYKWLGEDKIYVPSIMDDRGWQKDPTDDSKVVAKFAKVFNQADMIVTYFGKGFDIKFINAKMLEHGLPVLPNIPHVDLFYTVKGNLALTRKSLQNVAEFLKLEEDNPLAVKTPVTKRVWRKAQAGHVESIQYIIEHCKSDIELLEALYLRIRPLQRTHPRVSGAVPCRTCGSDKLQKRGLALTVNQGRKQRVQCQGCGAWDSRPVSEVDIAPARSDITAS